jgi:hypothetical protein
MNPEPFKADAPLIINAKAVLPHSIPAQLFQPIRWWNA